MTKRCCSERCRAALYRAPPGNRNELWECLSISDELETWDSGRQEEKDRRQIETFRRIHQLYKRGFRPDWTITDVEDAWRHPGGHPDLTLYADGRLFEMERFVLNPNEKRYEKCDGERIYNNSKADSAAFDQWLASAKRPKWWQAGKAARERHLVTPLIMAAFLGVNLLFALILGQIWRQLFR